MVAFEDIGLTRKERKHIAALKKRAAHLSNRITESTDKRLTYDEAELDALRFALAVIARTYGVDIARIDKSGNI